MQVPLVHVWPVPQAWPQLPQLAVLVVVSMHTAGDPHSIWPATGQPQVLFTQVAPAEHVWPQLPQLDASLARFAHAPPAHSVSPAGQLLEQLPLLQACVPEQVIAQLPQWLLSDGTQALLQESNPPWH